LQPRLQHLAHITRAPRILDLFRPNLV